MNHQKDISELHTERIILRGIDESDAEEIVRWRGDPEVYRYFKAPHQITLTEHLDWYHYQYLTSPDRMDWIGLLAENGRKIGVFGLVFDGDAAEVSYLLAPEAQHFGYAVEAVRELIRFAFSTGIRQVTAEIHRENSASLNLARRLGFRQMDHKGDFLIYGIEE